MYVIIYCYMTKKQQPVKTSENVTCVCWKSVFIQLMGLFWINMRTSDAHKCYQLHSYIAISI